MGKRKGKLVLARIENPVNRRVTFSKRKMGLVKKANELSVLCDVEIALLIYSGKGKLYQFGSPNMEKTIKRYIHFNSSNQHFDHQSQNIEVLSLELENLQKVMDNLEKTNKYITNEEIDTLSLKELLHHEKKLEKGLHTIRSTKVKLLEQILRSFTRQSTDKDVVEPQLDSRSRLCYHEPYEDEDVITQEQDPTELIGFEPSLELRL